MSPFPSRRALTGLAITIVASVAPTAGAADPPCFAPFVDAAAVVVDGVRYSPEDEATIVWSAFEGGAYELQVANDIAFSSLVQTVGPIAHNKDEWTVENLPERKHFYRMRALSEPGVCATGPWGNKVAVVQDATGPVVTIDNTSTDICGVPVTPTTPVYCFEDEVRLVGRAEDRPAPTAPSGVGPFQVAIALQNTTPVLGGGQPVFETVSVDTDGTWFLRLKGDKKPATGMYAASAVGIDRLGNPSQNAAILAYIVIL